MRSLRKSRFEITKDLRQEEKKKKLDLISKSTASEMKNANVHQREETREDGRRDRTEEERKEGETTDL